MGVSATPLDGGRADADAADGQALERSAGSDADPADHDSGRVAARRRRRCRRFRCP